MSDAALLSNWTLRFISYPVALERIVHDPDTVKSARLPHVAGLRLMYDPLDAGNPQEPVNQLGGLVAEALGHPHKEEWRGQLGFYVADAAGGPAAMPDSVSKRIEHETAEARRRLGRK
ncbi:MULTISPECIES: hypothetical protein [Streptacidiphilus]|uniref:Uncharacterized protein n=1 Tax=Streptacidiphilus cavernicola TaxID=3342716 RepID=A0ABV6UP38_9ACTN|nr:hypothetical protein [Streptacidiphilus jeojiense]